VSEPPTTLWAGQVPGVGVPTKFTPGWYAPFGKQTRFPLPTVPFWLPQKKSFPIERLTLAQLAPLAGPQLQAPQLWAPEYPVYQSPSCVPVGQVCAPSKIWQMLACATGTHTRPLPQPPPTVDVEQNTALAVQVGDASVGVPPGVQPLGLARNGVVATP
jgi:hypothetical protein